MFAEFGVEFHFNLFTCKFHKLFNLNIFDNDQKLDKIYLDLN